MPWSPSKASRTPSRFCSQPKWASNPPLSPNDLADFEPCLADSGLDLGHHVIRAPVENGRGQHGVRAGLHGGREVRRLAGTAGGDDGNPDGSPDQPDELEVE